MLLAAATTPLLLKNRGRLIHDRLIQAGALFVTVEWLAALYSPEFHTNTSKAAIRFTAGFVLLAIVRSSQCERFMVRVWAIAAAAAAVYALIAYAGFGFPGSFEYPNTQLLSLPCPYRWFGGVRSGGFSVFGCVSYVVCNCRYGRYDANNKCFACRHGRIAFLTDRTVYHTGADFSLLAF